MWIQYYQNIVSVKCIFPKSSHIYIYIIYIYIFFSVYFFNVNEIIFFYHFCLIFPFLNVFFLILFCNLNYYFFIYWGGGGVRG